MTDPLEMAVVDAGADMQVKPDEMQAIAANQFDSLVKLRMPDTMLAVFATRICLVAMAVPETRIGAKPDAVTGRQLPELVQHVDGADIHLDLVLDDAAQSRAVENIGGVDDARSTREGRAGGKSGPLRAIDFAERHGVHKHTFLTHEGEDVDVGARLLRIADHVEGAELPYPIADRRRVVDP